MTYSFECGWLAIMVVLDYSSCRPALLPTVRLRDGLLWRGDGGFAVGHPGVIGLWIFVFGIIVASWTERENVTSYPMTCVRIPTSCALVGQGLIRERPRGRLLLMLRMLLVSGIFWSRTCGRASARFSATGLSWRRDRWRRRGPH